MPRIHAPELAQALRQRYGVRGADMADTISPELVPVVIADHLEAAGGYPAAGAGDLGEGIYPTHIMLEAPENLDVLIEVERITVSFGATGVVRVFRPDNLWAFAGQPGTWGWRDARIAGLPSARIYMFQDVPFPGTDFARVLVSNETPTTLEIGAFLTTVGPGRQLIVSTEVIGRLTVHFNWTETWPRPGDRLVS